LQCIYRLVSLRAMPLQKIALTREQAYAMQEDLLAAFQDEAFQRRLVARWKAAGDDMVQQAKARQEVCLEVQGPIIAKYGFEASRKGVAMSVLAFQAPELGDEEIGERNRRLGYLADPSKRVESVTVVTRRSGRDYQGGVRAKAGAKKKAAASKADAVLPSEAGPDAKAPGAPPPEAQPCSGTLTVDISVGASCYEGLEVPPSCTVGQWKQLMAAGFLGKPVMYAERFSCYVEGTRKEKAGRGLDDAAPLPKPPDRMSVHGPSSILNMLELGLKQKLAPPDRRPRLGSYRMGKEIGAGIMGVCVYRAEHVKDGSEAALKWPAKPEEVRALRDIDRRAPIGCLGIPHLLASGTYRESPYIVTELLGERLSTAFPKPWLHPLEARWMAFRVIGRMLLHRLNNLHKCGYVHCDVSPENVLLGPGGPQDENGVEDDREALCLVDFGLAKPYPGSEPMDAGKGSAEWSSIRSADGGVRRPEDDLEALAWVLLYGLFGSLPWVPVLSAAYAEWSVDEHREAVLRQVKRMKVQLLDYVGTGCIAQQSGWDLGGLDWQRFAETPRDLYQFFRVCQTEVKPPQRPDYAALAALLGYDGSLTPMGAEQQDRRDWRKYVAPLI